MLIRLSASAFAVAVVVTVVSPAVAAVELPNLVGNTLKMTTRGAVMAYQFSADHALTAIVPGGTRMTGTWRVNGDQMCLKLGMHGFMGPETCMPKIPADKKPGDSWDITYNGVTTHGEIVAGQAR